MAGENVIRKDVVQIGFDIEDSPIATLQKLVDNITSSANGMTSSVDNITNEVSEMANEMQKAANVADELGNTGVSGLAKDVEKTAEEARECEVRLSAMMKSLAGDAISRVKQLPKLIQSSATAAREFAASLKAKVFDSAVSGANKLKSGLKAVVSLKVSDAAKGLDKGLGKAVVSAKNLASNLKASAVSKITSGVDKLKSKFSSATKESSKIKPEIDKATESISKATKETEGLRSKLGGVGSVVAKSFGGMAVAAGGGAVALSTAVVKSFGELEQNVGGAESVFQDLGKTINDMKASGQTFNATTGQMETSVTSLATLSENAYKTMGISQSDYLATANKMGALFQGSGLEQQRSLDLTTQAMQRAADMASVMGIDQASAMEAVTGAAKGNYEMMDNLGVAMNATTLEAYALSQGINTAWDDMSNAEKAELSMKYFFERTQQYAGNFEREATETVSGSFGLMQAAAQSFVAGLGNADADMTNLTKNLVDAFQAVVKNITPVLQNLVKALPDALDALLQAVGELLPTLLEIVTQLFEQLLTTLLELLPSLIPVAVNAVLTIVQTLVDNLPLIIQAGVTLIMSLIEGISEAAPTLIPTLIDAIITAITQLAEQLPAFIEAGVTMIKSIAEGIMEALPSLIDTLATNLPGIIDTVYDTLLTAMPQVLEGAKQFFGAILDALPGIISQLLEMLPGIINTLTEYFQIAFPMLLDASIDLLMALVDALPEILDALIDALPGIIDAIINFIITNIPVLVDASVKLFMALVKAIPKINIALAKAVPKIIVAIIKGLGPLGKLLAGTFKEAWNNVKNVFAPVGQFFSGVWKSITSIFDKASNWVTDHVITPVMSVITGFKESVTNIFSGIWDGITSIFSNVGGWFSEKFQEAYNGLTGVFSNISEFFSGLWDNIKGAFTTIGTNIGEAVGGAFKAVINKALEIVEDTINGGIRLINSAIKIINKIPKVDISTIDEVEFGRLAKGGIVESPTIAEIGEAGKEAVIPLENNLGWIKKIIRGVTDSITSSGSTAGSYERDVITSNNNSRTLNETNNYNPTFVLNMNGASATDDNKRKVMAWIKEALKETFDDLDKDNMPVVEI